MEGYFDLSACAAGAMSQSGLFICCGWGRGLGLGRCVVVGGGREGEGTIRVTAQGADLEGPVFGEEAGYGTALTAYTFD